MTISLDTNAIVRLFIVTDPAQTTAVEHCFETYDTVRLGNIALLESVYILAYMYKLGRESTAKYLHVLFSHPKVSYDSALFNPTLRYFVEHPGLSIEDCCAAIQATLDEATPLLTFDRKLARQLPQAELLT